MAINTSKAIAGGIVAGIVVNIFDFLSYTMVIGDSMKADLNAFKPGLGDSMQQMSGGETAAFVIMDLVVGMLLVWSYAAFRARFGPGPKTAVYVALVFFAFGLIITSGYLQMGLMSQGTWLTYGAVWLVCLIVATIAGAAVYKEEGSTA
jgi:hypothetical protein